eukprot:2163635-Pleurochrysis_carterae.AAC.1
MRVGVRTDATCAHGCTSPLDVARALLGKPDAHEIRERLRPRCAFCEELQGREQSCDSDIVNHTSRGAEVKDKRALPRAMRSVKMCSCACVRK